SLSISDSCFSASPLFFLFQRSGYHRDLHSFPTRRSSDLILEEFPNFHCTFNVVPSLGLQLEEYASGTFNEPWFELVFRDAEQLTDRKSTRLNSSHLVISYAVFCLKKKIEKQISYTIARSE